MKGTDLAWFRKLRRVTNKPITAAGGIRSLREVRALEKLGMHAAVGMALYLGKLSGSCPALSFSVTPLTPPAASCRTLSTPNPTCAAMAFARIQRVWSWQQPAITVHTSRG